MVLLVFDRCDLGVDRFDPKGMSVGSVATQLAPAHQFDLCPFGGLRMGCAFVREIPLVTGLVETGRIGRLVLLFLALGGETHLCALSLDPFPTVVQLYDGGSTA